MIAAYARWHAVLADSVDEQLKDGGGAIVRMHADASDIPREPIDEAVDDEFPSDETWGGRYGGQTSKEEDKCAPCCPS